MIDLATFSERLKQLRESRGLSVKELGNLVGKSDANISRYERGVHGPGRSVILKLAEVFGVNPVWLMGSDAVSRYETLAENNTFRQVPIYSFVTETMNQDNIIGYESTSENIDFCMTIPDNSMASDRIHQNDIAYITRQSEVKNNDIALVLLKETATIHRVVEADKTRILIPGNTVLKRQKIIGIVKQIKFNV